MLIDTCLHCGSESSEFRVLVKQHRSFSFSIRSLLPGLVGARWRCEGLASIIPRGIWWTRLQHVWNPYAASVRANLLLPLCWDVQHGAARVWAGSSCVSFSYWCRHFKHDMLYFSTQFKVAVLSTQHDSALVSVVRLYSAPSVKSDSCSEAAEDSRITCPTTLSSALSALCQ